MYHVTNRGLERREIVRDDPDRRTWLRLLDRVATRCRWRVFAYVLMDNHFHLFLRIRECNLSSGMHDLESGYATLFNQNHDRNGPLLQGRFHGVIVEGEAHSRELTRYLHLNPVRAGLVADPLQYRWSSHSAYLNPRYAPGWLDYRSVLAEFAARESAARVAYKRFVDSGVRQPPSNPLDAAVDGWILGSEAFVARCRELAERETARLQPALTLDAIAVAVQTHFGVDGDVLRQRGRHGNRPRDIGIWLARELVPESLESLAAYFGAGSRSAITETVRRVRERLQQDPKLRQTVDEIRRRL